MKFWVIAAACLASAPVLAAPAVSAGTSSMIRASNPKQIVDQLQKWGYRAQLETDNVGDPIIRSAVGGYNISVLFYGCEQGKNCSALQFSTGVATKSKVNWEELNALNRDTRYLKLYLDADQDPMLEYDLATGTDGITVDAFQMAFQSYERNVGRLRQLVEGN